MDMTKTITLTRPITSHQGELKTITFKEPRARTFATHGDPFKVLPVAGTEEYETIFNNKVMLAFMADMSGHDELTLDMMCARDFQAARGAVVALVLGLAGAVDGSPTAA